MVFEGITFKTATGKTSCLEIDHLNPNILTAGSPSRIRKIKDYLDKAEIFEGNRGNTVVNGEYQGLPVSGFATGMGPASTAIIIPEAIEVTKGPIVMIRLGTCGSLQPFVKIGDFVIASGAVRDERTTQAAVDLGYPAIANIELVPILIAAAEKHGYELSDNIWTGIIRTKDDLYFIESPQFSPSAEAMMYRLKSYKKMGVLASEMEFSVHCIMRDFYEGCKEDRILVGSILAVISSLTGKGRIDVSKANRSKLEKDLIEIGLDALVLTNRLRDEKVTDVNFGQIIQKMMWVPPRSKLLSNSCR